MDSIAENIDDMELKVNQLCWVSKILRLNVKQSTNSFYNDFKNKEYTYDQFRQM